MTMPQVAHQATLSSPTSAFTSAEAAARFGDELETAAANRLQQLHALSRAGEDHVVSAQREGLVHTIAEIHSALQRLDDGSFGQCASCNDPIPLERLEFRPWSATCVSCARH